MLPEVRPCLRRQPSPVPAPASDKWHLDEVFIRIGGPLRYLWRAVDQNGIVLDILSQNRNHGTAAKRFFKRLLKSLQYTPRGFITHRLKSYGRAERAVLPDVEHRES